MDFFRGREAVIATKHGKEAVIAPILEKELGLICSVPAGLETDRLGTFSGEIKRIDDPLTTLRKKCRMALEATGARLAVANEGTFGPHPGLFLAHADDELVMLRDDENDLEITAREVSLETNFNGAEIASTLELATFAAKIGFPAHGIILKRAKDDYSGMVKRSGSLEELLKNFAGVRKNDGSAYAETDMRAMHNPTRMKVIAQAAAKLAALAKSSCPACGWPGFGVVEVLGGLPCEVCGAPTRSTLRHIHRCRKCAHEFAEAFPLGKEREDPRHCDYCNP